MRPKCNVPYQKKEIESCVAWYLIY
jgi:hypothetical protein